MPTILLIFLVMLGVIGALCYYIYSFRKALNQRETLIRQWTTQLGNDFYLHARHDMTAEERSDWLNRREAGVVMLESIIRAPFKEHLDMVVWGQDWHAAYPPQAFNTYHYLTKDYR